MIIRCSESLLHSFADGVQHPPSWPRGRCVCITRGPWAACVSGEWLGHWYRRVSTFLSSWNWSLLAIFISPLSTFFYRRVKKKNILKIFPHLAPTGRPCGEVDAGWAGALGCPVLHAHCSVWLHAWEHACLLPHVPSHSALRGGCYRHPSALRLQLLQCATHLRHPGKLLHLCADCCCVS